MLRRKRIGRVACALLTEMKPPSRKMLGHCQRLLAGGWRERKVKLREILSLQAKVQRRSIFANMGRGSRARDCPDAIRPQYRAERDLEGRRAGMPRRNGMNCTMTQD